MKNRRKNRLGRLGSRGGGRGRVPVAEGGMVPAGATGVAGRGVTTVVAAGVERTTAGRVGGGGVARN